VRAPTSGWWISHRPTKARVQRSSSEGPTVAVVPNGEQTGSFKTHAGYLHALSYLCGYVPFQRDPGVITALAGRIQAEPSYQQIVTRGGFDGEQLRRSLHAAWGSELLLVVSGTYAPEELQGVSNTWVAIQVYYACYHAIQALIVARGQPRPSSHPTTQRMFIDAWVTPTRDLMPWSLGAIHGGYKNLPQGHVVDEAVHPWAALDATSAIDVACKAFRTTREDAIVEAKKEGRSRKRRDRRRAWLQQEQQRLARGRRPRNEPVFALPRLTATEHQTVEARVRAYGLLDYLYRLRIKSQYEDSTLFIEGPEHPTDSLLAFQHLRQIVSSTLLLHEFFIERIVGRPVFEPIVDGWLQSQQAAPVNPLTMRGPLVLP
jgi:hypothetical protein